MNLIVPAIHGLHLDAHQQKIVQSWKADEVRIVPYKKENPRTNKSNAYYWSAVIGTIAAETGHTPQEIHEYAKWTFLAPILVEVGNDKRYISRSTTSLSTREFAEYIEMVKAWAANELSLVIPEPQDE